MTDYNKLPGLTTALKEILDLVQENAHLKAVIEEYEMYNPYKRGKLYIIRNTTDDKVYVGATYQELNERMKEHRKDSKNPTRQSKLYVHMRKVGRDNFTISLLKLAPCKSKWHLENEEYDEQVKIPEDNVYGEPITRRQLVFGKLLPGARVQQVSFHEERFGLSGRPTQPNPRSFVMGIAEALGKLTRPQGTHPIDLVRILPANGATANRQVRTIVVHHQFLAAQPVVALGAALAKVACAIEVEVPQFKAGADAR